MEFDPQKLEAILDILVHSGVEEFEGYGFHVRFTERMFAPEKEVPIEQPTRSEDIDTVWKDPKLWPGGKPPSFPK